MNKPDKSEPITISAQDLDKVAQLAGYDGEKPLGVYDKLLALRDSQGENVFKRTVHGYVEGINFLKEYSGNFSDQDIICWLKDNSLGYALPALATLKWITDHPTPGAPVQNRVEVFVNALFATK